MDGAHGHHQRRCAQEAFVSTEHCNCRLPLDRRFGGQDMEDWTGVQTAVGQGIRWKTERRRVSAAEDKPPASLQPCLLVRYFRPTVVSVRRHDSREQQQQQRNSVACSLVIMSATRGIGFVTGNQRWLRPSTSVLSQSLFPNPNQRILAKTCATDPTCPRLHRPENQRARGSARGRVAEDWCACTHRVCAP